MVVLTFHLDSYPTDSTVAQANDSKPNSWFRHATVQSFWRWENDPIRAVRLIKYLVNNPLPLDQAICFLHCGNKIKLGSECGQFMQEELIWGEDGLIGISYFRTSAGDGREIALSFLGWFQSSFTKVRQGPRPAHQGHTHVDHLEQAS